ncbi:unnamed protein product [Closterium sp. NIES-65]|nr:unnamed protein product [Closterium sp. NIES-65]
MGQTRAEMRAAQRWAAGLVVAQRIYRRETRRRGKGERARGSFSSAGGTVGEHIIPVSQPTVRLRLPSSPIPHTSLSLFPLPFLSLSPSATRRPLSATLFLIPPLRLPLPPLRLPRPPVRQLGLPTDLAAVALLAQAADDYVRGDKSTSDKSRANLLALVAQTGGGGAEGEAEAGEELGEELIAELDACMLSYFGFHWPHSALMIEQVFRGPSSKLHLRDAVNAVIRQRRFNEAITCLRPQQRFSQLLEEMKVLGCGPRLGGAGGVGGGGGGVEQGRAEQGKGGQGSASEGGNGREGRDTAERSEAVGRDGPESESGSEVRLKSTRDPLPLPEGDNLTAHSPSHSLFQFPTSSPSHSPSRSPLHSHSPSRSPSRPRTSSAEIPREGEVMVPAAAAVRSPVLLLIGGGMGAGKSTVVKEIMKRTFWAHMAPHAVVVEADAFKEKDAIFRALSADRLSDAARISQLVHEESTRAAQSTLVTALNEGRDVIFDGTMSWAPFVQQTIAMARRVHERRFRMGPGYRVKEDGSVVERYWEEVEEEDGSEGVVEEGKERADGEMVGSERGEEVEGRRDKPVKEPEEQNFEPYEWAQKEEQQHRPKRHSSPRRALGSGGGTRLGVGGRAAGDRLDRSSCSSSGKGQEKGGAEGMGRRHRGGEMCWERRGRGGGGEHRLPYRIELVGVMCDAHLAVVRGMRRAILTKRGVPVHEQLRSHKLFASSVEAYCDLVDVATLYSTNHMGGPPQLIGYKEGTSPPRSAPTTPPSTPTGMITPPTSKPPSTGAICSGGVCSHLLVDSAAFHLVSDLKRVNPRASCVLELYFKEGEGDGDGDGEGERGGRRNLWWLPGWWLSLWGWRNRAARAGGEKFGPGSTWREVVLAEERAARQARLREAFTELQACLWPAAHSNRGITSSTSFTSLQSLPSLFCSPNTPPSPLLPSHCVLSLTPRHLLCLPLSRRRRSFLSCIASASHPVIASPFLLSVASPSLPAVASGGCTSVSAGFCPTARCFLRHRCLSLARWRLARWRLARWRLARWRLARWRHARWRHARWRLARWRLGRWRLARWRLARWRLARWRLARWRLARWRLGRSRLARV